MLPCVSRITDRRCGRITVVPSESWQRAIPRSCHSLSWSRSANAFNHSYSDALASFRIRLGEQAAALKVSGTKSSSDPPSRFASVTGKFIFRASVSRALFARHWVRRLDATVV